MKYLLILALLLVGAFGGLLALNVGLRWSDDMFYTQRVMPGEMAFTMPPGSLARSGSEMYFPKEAREAAAARKNPVAATPQSVRRGSELFAIYCTPCHGASGKGEGLVSAKFVPPPDLTNSELQKTRTDGYWQSYLSAGGAVMPSYSEALSPEERWDVVNYLRTLARQ
ncbi:MAG TPA: cytochrome c [Candidatus Methylomirabilis sp.]|nr:cytochrome c [Candidatus Methylomirabilis sp.]